MPRPQSRRLAALLHADVVGYSALMSADEAGTQAAVTAAMELAKEISTDHGGRLVGTAGDAFLAEFPSVVEAVAAAVEFQQAMAKLPADGLPRLTFRAGINLGDVIAVGEEIFGEGVNVAARIEALAPAGGLAITAAVKDQLGNRLDIAFAEGGTHALKNLPAPVRIFVAAPPFPGGETSAPPLAGQALGRGRGRLLAFLAVLAVAVAAAGVLAWRGTLAPPPTAETAAERASGSRPVVAVLPFGGGSASTEDSYFADGFTEDIIAQLGRFPELIVLSWNAVAPYRGLTTDLETLRHKLNARYVIGGSIRQAGDTLRVSVSLTDAADGALLWSQRYDTTEAKLFDLQDQITGAAAGSLAVGVERVEQRQALETPTSALDAYDLVLRARALLRRVDRDDNLKARDLFQAALDRDPDYADARAGLAWTHVNDLWWGWSEWRETSFRRGFDLASEALSGDPRNIAALTAIAELLWIKGDLAGSRVTCERAVELNPNDARARATCGGVSVFAGALEEGIAHGELALQLDPEQPSWLLANLGIGYFLTERYEDVVTLLSQSTHMAHENPSPHAVLAAAYAHLGRTEAAREEVGTTLRLYPFFNPEIFAGNMAHADQGEKLLSGLRAAGFK